MADRDDGFGHAGGGPAGPRAGHGRGRSRAGGGTARGRPAARTPGPQFIPPNGLGFERPPRPVRRGLRGPGLRRARWPAGAARRGGRLRDPGPRRPRRRRRRRDHGRVHAGPGAAGPGAAPARDASHSHRGPRSGPAPRRAARGRAGHRAAGGRAGPGGSGRAGPGRAGRAGRGAHPGASVPAGGGAGGQEAFGVRGLGAAGGRVHRRGRLRRGVPLRPAAGRRDAGPGAGPDRVRGQHEQDAGAGDAARLAGRAPRRCAFR